jgi:cell division protease FtsH
LVSELFEKETLDREQISQIFAAIQRRPTRPAWTGSPTRRPSEIPPVEVPKQLASPNGKDPGLVVGPAPEGEPDVQNERQSDPATEATDNG